MKPAELRCEILVSYLSDVDHAREELQRVEKNARRYLKTNKVLKAGYDEFIKNGGGTLKELKHWLASHRSLRMLAQKKHIRPVVCNDYSEAL